MQRESIQSQLVTQGLDVRIAEVFARSCTFRMQVPPHPTGPQILMETLVVGRRSGAFASSTKPANILVNVPSLVVSSGGAALSYLATGNALTALISGVVLLLGAKVNISKNDAALVLALHDLGAYSHQGRYIDEVAALDRARGYCADWSIVPLDLLKLRESVSNLLSIKSIDIKDDRFALREFVLIN